MEGLRTQEAARVTDPFWKQFEAQGVSGSAKIYVGTYSKYNSGSIFGAWIDLELCEDAETFWKACRSLHSDECDPEFMFQDWENIPGKFTSVGSEFVDVEGFFEFINEFDVREQSVITEYWEEVDTVTDGRKVLESLVYEGEFSEFAAAYADEQMECCGCPEFFREFFDYDKFERSLSYDYFVTEHFVFSNC